MRTIVTASLVLTSWMPCALAQNANPARPPAPPRSPEIAADHRVTFRLQAPAATEVVLTGEFLKGNQPLTKGADGVWSVTVGPIEPEIYNYNFTIDGVKTIDPGNANVKSGSTPSTIASVLEISGAAPAFYDGQPVPHGDVHTLWYESKSLHALRRVTVYTPPGYETSGRTRYPVLYLFHGANADETAWTRLGRANLILDNLMASGKIVPFITVMPFGYPGVPATLGPGGSGPGFSSTTEGFGRDLLGDVIPLIDSKFRTISDRDHRAIAGLSMGGGESLEIGLHHPETFSYVGGFSAALRPADFSKTYGSVAAGLQPANRRLRLLWFACGKDDSLFAASQSFSKFLGDAGIQHDFRQTEGAHTWMVWRRYLSEFAPLLFEAAPKSGSRTSGSARQNRNE